jgi:hypothetical protein
MKDNQAFAGHFLRVRQLRAPKPVSSVKESHMEGTDGFNS